MSGATHAGLAARLVGVWALERYTLDLADGAIEPLGSAPRGRLAYTADGFMSAHLAPAAGAGEPPAATLGYCGRWRLDGERVLHEVEISSRAGMAGTTQVRPMAFVDGALVLTAANAREAPGPGARTGTGTLVWRRLEGAA